MTLAAGVRQDLGLGGTHLHLVDVGRVVADAAIRRDRLAAAVGHQSAVGARGCNVHAGRPVLVAVAAAALELERDKIRQIQ